MTSLKTSIKTITYLSDIGCLEILGASLVTDIIFCWGIATITYFPTNKKTSPNFHSGFFLFRIILTLLLYSVPLLSVFPAICARKS
ncbi:hypothetical protein C7B16_16735 [Escherichia sp. 20412-1]|nr:hypothetical protein C7B16_16735 [Escherichia sp. 20412-1]